MALAAISLDDKYEREQGTVYLTGSQAFVRLAMMQLARDRTAGLNTACFISGYRGSPMHNVDKELWRAKRFLEGSPIHFVPAVNEDLAATSIWGSQQATLWPDAKHDGVFALWYGKGPGLDRSVDAIRHANLAGTAPHGGVLAVVGDDHPMKSSDVPATSEPTFIDLMMPVLYPATVQEILDLGVHGWAMSRFCGAWVGFKTLADTLDTAVSVDVDPARPEIVIPHFEFPADGVHIRLPDPWVQQEGRLRRAKMGAALAYARANRLNHPRFEARAKRLGIIASGKSALDTEQALLDLGLDPGTAADLGISLLQVSMPHPEDLETIREFALGHEEIVVVEEKRRIIELQVKDALYALPDGQRPRVVGRFDEQGQRLLSEVGELSPDDIARALGARIARFHQDDRMRARLGYLQAQERQARERPALPIGRLPYFCSGCPHNTSTRVPDGSRAHGGVGCHYMSTYMDRGVHTHTHMGGEGATWIGQAPFVETPHVFQNLGDGTYYHCGLLAIRACVAARVNITYRILFNDAVAMTGGQPIDGPLDPMAISRQVQAEGVKRIVVVSDEPEKYPFGAGFAPGTTIEHRRSYDRVQREIREVEGVSVIIYDQTCAAEKRRRRKRGQIPDPPLRVLVNDRVCEGCGDCNAKSNCLSVLPLDTEFGRKRRIDQSACNKDYSCLEGFCPSFVSVVGGKPRRAAAKVRIPEHLREVPEPARPDLDERPWSALVTGIGGTGVVTVGAMLTMAAHLEGRACSAVDQFGMAQKGGPVTSHVRLAAGADQIRSVRIQAGAADLLLGCDSLVAGIDLALDTIGPRTRVVVNTFEAITGHFTRDPDLVFPSQAVTRRLRDAAGPDNVDLVDATRIATALMGDSIATNLFMLGVAYQKGLVPVSAQAIDKALELNAVAVAWNQEAFLWGRRLAVDPETVARLAEPASVAPHHRLSENLDEMVSRRVADLTAYQDAAYARRYRALVDRVREAERTRAPGMSGLAEAVARYAYKLMAYKDEYEVARLFTDGDFERALAEQFEGEPSLRFHFSPPLLAPKDKDSGLPRKITLGAWAWPLLKVLARMRRLRGTALDLFGYHPERRRERRLVVDYESVIEELMAGLDHDSHPLAVEIASVPEQIRGYGHVKHRHLEQAGTQQRRLLERWRAPAERRKTA